MLIQIVQEVVNGNFFLFVFSFPVYRFPRLEYMLYHPFGEEQTACVLSKLVFKLVEKSLLLDNVLAVLTKYTDFRTLDLGESLLDLCHDKAT